MNRKIVIDQQFADLNKFVKSIPERFANEGDVIYDARNQIRVFTLDDGRKINVKRFAVPHAVNRIVYSFFRQPKAIRAYENAQKLLANGISTPQPIGYIIETTCGLISTSYLVTEQSKLSRNFYEFRAHELHGFEDIVREFARFSAEMHQKNILHKDYSPGNILFEKNADGRTQFTLVDINRMRFNKPIKPCEIYRNFCRLWGKQDFFECLAQEYAAARRWDAEECRREIVKYWKRFWKHRK